MGLHTWCCKRIDLTVQQGIDIVLSKIEIEIKLSKQALEYFHRGEVIDWLDPQCDIQSNILLFEASLQYYRKIRNAIKLGQIREAALRLDISFDGFDYYHRLNQSFFEHTNFHDIFRTSKLNNQGYYTDDLIFSKEECDIWLNKNHETVYDLNEELIEQFWFQCPDGMIYFG